MAEHAGMRCPRCDLPLETRRHQNVGAEVCASCGGMFLDHGELNALAAPTSGDVEFATLDGDSFQHDDTWGPTVCPRCDTGLEMRKVEFNIHTNIILDYCEHCQGFWLDGREFERINEEVRDLNEAAEEVTDPPMLWFARFLWNLPK